MIEPTWVLFPNRVEPGGYTDPDMADRRNVTTVTPRPPDPLVIGWWSILVAILAVGLCTVAAGIVGIGRRFYRLTLDEVAYQRRRFGRWLVATGAGLLPTAGFCYVGG